MSASPFSFKLASSFSSLASRSLEAASFSFFERFALDFELHHSARNLVEFGRHRIDFGAQLGRGFVDEIDRLIGQESIGDVAVGQDRRGDQGGILDAHAVMHFIPLSQSAQDRDRVLDRWLIDEHRLKAPFQRGILFDVLAIFIERGRADAMQFAASQHRLQEIAGVHRALGLAGADDRVQLVNEEDDRALRFCNLLEYRLEPFLEFAAILRAGDQAPPYRARRRACP